MHRDTYVMAFLEVLLSGFSTVCDYTFERLSVDFFAKHATKVNTNKIDALRSRILHVWDDISRFICAPSTGSCEERIPLGCCGYHELLLKEGITGTQKQYDMDIYAAGKGCFILQGHPHITKEEVETTVQKFFASRWGNSDCMQEVIASAKSFGVYNWDFAIITRDDIKSAHREREIIHPSKKICKSILHTARNCMLCVSDGVHSTFFYYTCGL